ncbi:MAG: hypothetical protein GYA24_07690 [Candidatus Lokiarchaeota archaeon]|nr:hypothetical protein [Candidatus Lokiarchaeota archaeon]
MFSLALEVRVYHFLGCLDISRVDLDEFLGDGLEIDLSRYPSATLNELAQRGATPSGILPQIIIHLETSS